MSRIKLEKDISCRDDFDPASLPPAEALERILSFISPVDGVEKIAIRDALNRVLADDVISRINVPTGTNSAMDGYAVNGDDIPADGVAELHVIGTAWAGKPLQESIKPGTCARIMTGAILPRGADTVIIQEDVERDADNIRIDAGTRRGDNVRQAGEDIKEGDIVLHSGRRLNPADIGLIASLGIGEVAVTRRLRVAFFSTGDELRSIGEPLEEGCIYDSNRYTLHTMLRRLNADIIDMGVIRDERQAIEDAFLSAAGCADVVITSGGVSVGEADYVRETLNKVGDVAFWKVAMKPGRPLAFGTVRDAIFFGLPGNPVSVMVTFYQFVQPALRAMSGDRQTQPVTLRATCMSKLKKRPGRIEYQRGILERDDSGRMVVHKTGAQGSGILTSMARANCFMILGMDNAGVEEGQEVDVQPFYGLT
ncbi:MAG: gephyrin-like molybdotransferase Glp [Gammaproteobacteria bacterium]